jgi:HD-like signal output (HDOD) protein
MTSTYAFTTVREFLEYAQSEMLANRLVLPTLPDIAIKVREAVAKPDASSQEITAIIASDPALSIRLVQFANSPLYRGSQEIKNIQMAVTRLGNGTVRTLVTSLVIQQLFQPSGQTLQEYFQQIWQQSVNVSAICRALAKTQANLDCEEAMLAGLLHSIGKLPILTLVQNIAEFKNSPSRLDKLLDKAHTHMGKLIMDSWVFPEDLKPVSYEYANFSRDHEGPADYVDLVQVAFLQNIIGSDHPAGRIDWSSVPAFRKLGMEPDVEILQIEGVAEEIQTTQSLLR